MYLISIYFDKDTMRKIQGYINKVAKYSGNNFMIDNNVPPHITVAAFQSNDENKVIEVLDRIIKNVGSGDIVFPSIGIFKSSVIYLAPVLNEYLHKLSLEIHEGLLLIDNINISKFYMPFNWIPHATIGKKLSREELFLAFQQLEKSFSIFSGKVTKIALSKTNPYKDVIEWKL